MLEEILMKFQLVKHKCYLYFIRLKPKVNQKKNQIKQKKRVCINKKMKYRK